MSKLAKLRCCASCMWVFRLTPTTEGSGCPQCGFGHYGALFALGPSCYRAEVTQTPWLERKLQVHRQFLLAIIRENAPKPRGFL